MNYKLFIICIFAAAILTTLDVKAEVYQSPKDFLLEMFADQVPKSNIIWLTGDTGATITQILQHKPNTLRWRYWWDKNRSVWIVKEIGKEKPITVGVVINDNEIEIVRILVFRESRGWQIRYPFFTQQFTGVKINNQTQLNKTIDSISGATLSVRAVKRLSRATLFLHQLIKEKMNVSP